MIVAPDRETPGIRASDWAKPKMTPCPQVSDSSGRTLRAKWSTMPIMMPKPASIAAVIHRLRRRESIASWKSSAEHHDRDRADDHQPAHPGLGIVARDLADQRQAPVPDDQPDVVRK